MCKPHWHLVPKSIRDRVWIHWRARQQGRPGAAKLHMAAKTEAIAAATAAGDPPQGELL